MKWEGGILGLEFGFGPDSAGGHESNIWWGCWIVGYPVVSLETIF